jgi:hypothetical protein
MSKGLFLGRELQDKVDLSCEACPKSYITNLVKSIPGISIGVDCALTGENEIGCLGRLIYACQLSLHSV